MKILAVCTCFNRKDKTKECIETITSCNPGCEFTFVVADDGSTDGTVEMLMQMQNEYRIHIVKGDGTWFYSGGMHAGMEYAKEKLSKDFSYMLLINDDVEFLNQCILQMIDQSKEQRDAVIVGTMKDKNGMQSYGAMLIQFTKSLYYYLAGRELFISSKHSPCHCGFFLYSGYYANRGNV